VRDARIYVECDFCGAHAPWGGVIVGDLAHARFHYCERCYKPGRAWGACESVGVAERMRLAYRLCVRLRERLHDLEPAR
jgi:hypothetical protein